MTMRTYVDGWDVTVLRYDELRLLCRSLGLPVRGSEVVLRERLIMFKHFPSKFKS